MADKISRFTTQSRQALNISQQAAEEFLHEQIGPEHILIGLMREKDGAAFHIIRLLGVKPEDICESVEKAVKKGKHPPQTLNLHRDTKHLLVLAVDETRHMRTPYVSTGHLLLGMLSQRKSIALNVLRQFRVDYVKVQNATRRLENEGTIPEISEVAFIAQVIGLSASPKNHLISVLESHVKICGSVLSTVSQEQAKQVVNGQTVLQLLEYMTGFDEYVHQCALRILKEDRPELSAYNADEANVSHHEQSKDDLYAQLLQLRTQLVEFLRGLPDTQWMRLGVHPEFDRLSLLDLLVRFTAMDASNLEQITRVIMSR